MTVQEWLDDRFSEEKNEEKIEGEIEGQDQILALIAAMSEDGRANEIPRLSLDASFFQSMKEHYQI